jgi:predicted type IV restriction endonuclease
MLTLTAQDVTLGTLKEAFGLQHVQDSAFFPEWQMAENLAENLVSPLEGEILDRIKANFTSLMDRPPLLENSVKMVVLAPLLDLLGFYQPPFSIQTEPSIEIIAEDEGTIVRGRIDILVLKNRLWLTVIESKRSDFSVTRAIPQTLSYLLANPDSPTFGLITNGNEFLFIKADRRSLPNPSGTGIAQYGNSRLFSLINPNNDLYQVLSILKNLGQSLYY